MSNLYLLLVIVLIILAGFLREDFIFVLLYLLLGVYILGNWWSKKVISAIGLRRNYPLRAFFGEQIPVNLEITNSSRLPAVWLQLRENLPSEIRSGDAIQRVVSLGSKDHLTVMYELECRKRGYYEIGPLDISTGDIFGISQNSQRRIGKDPLIVFPKIIPLRGIRLLSHAPLGTLRHHEPIFEDPSRVFGKRDYIQGDSLRRVDWKATASVQRLQVKLFEPSIALECMMLLNLNLGEYDLKFRTTYSELAITVAASVANWVVQMRQSIGLATNGVDRLFDSKIPLPIAPKRGRGHLLRILEQLARIQADQTTPFIELLNNEVVQRSWGTTLIIIANQVNDELFDVFFQVQKSGLNAILVLCGSIPNYEEIVYKANYFNVPVFSFLTEQDLDVWRS